MNSRRYTTTEIIKIPFKIAPFQSLVMGLQSILDGIIPTLLLLLTARFLDTAISIVSNESELNRIFLPLGMLAFLILFSRISEGLMKFVDVKLEMKLRGRFRVHITEKRAKIKYAFVENEDTWNLVSRVSKEPEKRIKNAYKDLLAIVSMVIKMGGLLFIIVIHAWWAAVMIVVISLPLFKVALKNGQDSYDAERAVSKLKRKAEYLEEMLTGRSCAQERTLFGYTTEVNKKWEDEFEKARKIEFKTNMKNYSRSRLRSGIITAFTVIMVVVLLKPVGEGALSIGLFIALTNGLLEFSQMMSWQFIHYIPKLTENREFLKDLTEFYATEECEGAIDKPSDNDMNLITLEFRNVSFKYPNTDNYILKNLSFTIENGGHYAFVGVNGAGKTTITKLITGLYDDYEGEILLNGKSLREYSLAQIKGLSAVVYQDFAKYYTTLEENILLGDINNMDEESAKDSMMNALNVMELDEIVDGLPQKHKTILGKIKKDGLDFSGGQWQRVGMARALMSRAPLRILDEPTAALDPISESTIYERFEEISKGGTTIFISHRLGSTKIAKEIFVIRDGGIIEKGTHQELMNIKGEYAQMYDSQRSWYL